MIWRAMRRIIRLLCPTRRWAQQYPGVDWQLCLVNILHQRRQGRDSSYPFMVHFTSTVTNPEHFKMGRNVWQSVAASGGCQIHGGSGLTIGDDSVWAPNVIISTRGATRPVTIGRNVWIGAHANIKPGVRIGDHVTIGANSDVTADIPALSVAGGRPCRVLKQINETAIVEFRHRRGISEELSAADTAELHGVSAGCAVETGHPGIAVSTTDESPPENMPIPRTGKMRNLFYQRVLGLNGSAPFTVHFTSRVQDVQNIRIGAGVARSFAESGHCFISASNGLTMGDGTTFADGVVIQTSNHDLWKRSLNTVEKPVWIGNRVKIGTNVTITAGVNIGDDVVVLPGSVVTGDIPGGVTAGGVPCRVIEKRAA